MFNVAIILAHILPALETHCLTPYFKGSSDKSAAFITTEQKQDLKRLLKIISKHWHILEIEPTLDHNLSLIAISGTIHLLKILYTHKQINKLMIRQSKKKKATLWFFFSMFSIW